MTRMNTCSTVSDCSTVSLLNTIMLFPANITTPIAADTRMASRAPICPNRSVPQSTGTMIMYGRPSICPMIFRS